MLTKDHLAERIAAIPLVDHHCHGVYEHELSSDDFDQSISESNWPAPPGHTFFDSQIGMAIAKHCGPIIGAPANADLNEYVASRGELTPETVNERLLGTGRIEALIIDTGFQSDNILTPREMSVRADTATHEIVRLETLAEELLAETADPRKFLQAFPELLRSRLESAVGVKSIAAYRSGLEILPQEPEPSEVAHSLQKMLNTQSPGQYRANDQVLASYLLWEAAKTGTVIQVHSGFGDSDLNLNDANPALLSRWIKASMLHGSKVTLLHNYPFHREAAYLSRTFPNVYFDVGLSLNYVGFSARRILEEALEMSPFSKILYSSDAFGLSELYMLGGLLHRQSLTDILWDWHEDHDIPASRCEDIALKISKTNALEVYGL